MPSVEMTEGIFIVIVYFVLFSLCFISALMDNRFLFCPEESFLC